MYRLSNEQERTDLIEHGVQHSVGILGPAGLKLHGGAVAQ